MQFGKHMPLGQYLIIALNIFIFCKNGQEAEEGLISIKQLNKSTKQFVIAH
jgi:hypothetical protein